MPVNAQCAMYVCMYDHKYSKSMDQPGKVAICDDNTYINTYIHILKFSKG